MAGTPTLYLDPSAVAHERSWPVIEAALDTGKVRLVLSLWNLFEIGEATDQAQRERRLAFLEAFGPLWVLERIAIQKLEVQHFLWTEHFGVTEDEPDVFTPSLSVVDSYHLGPKAQLGLTARQWIARVDFPGFVRMKDLAPTALKILQPLGNQEIAKRQDEIFKAWIKEYIPVIDPDGKALTKKRMGELLDYCKAHQERFFGVCRCIAVEDALTAARVANPSRKPRRSDGIDLMHSAVALSYCDYFLVRDGFSRDCCERASKALAGAKLAAVYGEAEDLHKDLTT